MGTIDPTYIWRFTLILSITLTRPNSSPKGGTQSIHIEYLPKCWLWSLIFQIQRYYSIVFVPQVYCTLVPLALGFGRNAPEKRGFGGGGPKKIFWGVCWSTVMQTHGIGLTVVFSHGISPIKEKHCNNATYYIVL